MNRDKVYYQNLLRHLEYAQLETVGDLLQIELVIYDTRKLLREMQQIDEYDNPRLDNLKLGLRQLRKKHEILSHEISDLELDISHAKFMIDLLSLDKDDE